MGWTNKFHDADFAIYLQQFKIICLQETWATETNPPSLHGFSAYSVPAVKTSSKGRGSGGLAIFISVDLHVDIQSLDSSLPQYIQVLLIKSTFFGCVICINVYFPPRLAKNGDPNNVWIRLSETLTCLECQYPSTKLLLCGDFNARIEVDMKQGEGTNFGQDGQVTSADRVSQDTIRNKSGLSFLEVLSLHQLHCLNGTQHDITQSAYTYVTNRGASTIDYIAVSANLLPDIQRFAINNRVESDHFPLSLIFNFETSPPAQSSQNSQNLNGIHVGERRIRWSVNLGNSILHILESNPYRLHRQYILDSNTDILHAYQSIIQNLRPKLVCNKQLNPSKVGINRCLVTDFFLDHYFMHTFTHLPMYRCKDLDINAGESSCS
ncbi:uncharacterized protein LOC107983049 [Anolis carolinensis]|uniref:uncharacterized protein LOC107983049 n=1 Tax=Anolis carolinensis TaxID=28377 RepID=UPI0007DB7693|nr:PREDICTED: uncharacterized protein LOC107983049 [Anolis carolinensis]|eukprot:XP_016850336.1 PREDICTED: uncharacterized protein LOC107983049 [Anolis carolinensis]